MKRFLVFLLFSLYLFASTEACQFLKIPYLITHFYKHCKEDPKTTWQDFFAIHYSNEMIFDDDWSEDMQLPFKTCAENHSSVPFTGLPNLVSVPLPQSVSIFIFFTPKLPKFKSESPVQKIFQPPRCA